MSRLEWYALMYSAGDIDGAGLRKLLGASHHDPLALLVRETIQNSWDASRTHDGVQLTEGFTPAWTLELRTLRGHARDALVSAFSRCDVPGTELGKVLARDEISVLEISDRGTSGLGGPVRSDLAVPHGLTTDLIDLVYNIGAPQDTDGGGGTYGFGKIAAFGVSECATVLYRTQPKVGQSIGRPGEHRLVGSTIGDHFDMDGRRYTGRHWWGAVREDRPEPLLGGEAHDLGDQLFATPFHPGDTGTSILVIEPVLGDRTRGQAIQHIIDAVLWNAWPKLVPLEEGGPVPMDLTVLHDGSPVPIPDPSTTSQFAGFAEALRRVRARASDGDVPPPGPMTVSTRDEVFRSERPARVVGHAAVVTTLGGTPSPADPEDDGLFAARHFDGPPHHLALMREPELVVRYLEGPPLKTAGLQWSGVFKPSRDLDRCFAEAEPPSHDDWLIGRVSGRNEKIFVRRGRERGPKELFANLTPRPDAPAGSGPAVQLASIADALGHLVSTGESPRPKPRGPGRPKKPVTPAVRVGTSTPVTLPDGSVGVRLSLVIGKPSTIRVSASIALAGGGSDSSKDLGDRLPELIGVTADSTTPDGAVPQDIYDVDAGEWFAWFRNRGGSALAVDVGTVS